MRNKLLPILSVLVWSATQLAFANDIEPTKDKYTAIHTDGAITLDGKLNDWTGVPVLADPKFAVPKFSGTNASPSYVLFEQYDGGTWSGPNDQTSAVQIAWDADNVYFGFVVTDPIDIGPRAGIVGLRATVQSLAIDISAALPTGSAVQIEIRSGSTKFGQGRWSSWQRLVGLNETVHNLAGRYIQRARRWRQGNHHHREVNDGRE
jgi:hypothetical protein